MPAFKSPGEIVAERGDRPWVECRVEVAYPGGHVNVGTAKSSYTGISPCWTYNQFPPNEGVVTVKVSPL